MPVSKAQGTPDADVIAAAYRLHALKFQPSSDKAAAGRKSVAMQYLYDAVERHKSAQSCEVRHAQN
jgi:hypothetical protein